MRLHQVYLFVLALASRAFADFPNPVLDDGFELRRLTEANFKGSIQKGLWLVEHFSPRCSHCRAFAPTWDEVARKKAHLERLTGFHMAQVDCLAQGDLCNSNGIKFYPSLFLYSNGEHLSSYSGDRSVSDLSRWIDEQSTLYARGQLLATSTAEEDVISSKFGRPNPEGKVLEVDEAQLDVLKGNGPVLVDFYAPWCGHCKKLRPTYEILAEEVKNKINVAAVNCDENPKLCRSEDIKGYPTIRMYQGSKMESYTGARSLGGMKKFALKYVNKPLLQPVRLEDFGEIVSSEDAFFLYLQNFDTTVADLNAVKSALKPLKTLPSFTSSDPLLYSNLSIANPPPTSVLLAFSAPGNKPVASLPFPADSKALHNFVNLHMHPTLSQLSSANYADIMKSPTKPVVVLAIVHSGETGRKELERFEKIARAWKRGGRRFVDPPRPVWFVWIDGERWASWMNQAYGIKKKNLPAAVVIDPSVSEYYDQTIEKEPIKFEGASIFSVLEGFYQHFLRPKRSETALEWGSHSATMTLINLSEFSFDHPILAMVTVIGAVAVFIMLLMKCLGKDPREGRDGYGNGYGSHAHGYGYGHHGSEKYAGGHALSGSRLD